MSSLVRDVVNGVTVPGIASLKSTDKAQSPAIFKNAAVFEEGNGALAHQTG
ncbi:hypothetical protein [Mesorhizobium sp. M0091]|uniref:hypothetical protein n=1 Tax=Mesorhizobium sp. M0091 TaxID=2956875 RepID=UPI00333B61E0